MKPQGSRTDSRPSKSPRRQFLKQGGIAVAGTALAGMAVPHVHAAEDNTIRLALIGCGGRGGGAVANALNAPGGPVKLYTMADLFEDRIGRSYDALAGQFGEQIDVAADRRFVGFDAYRNAIDCLRPGDIAMLTAYAYCRPLHMEYAVDKGMHVFMEKSFAPDPGGLQRMLRTGELAESKNLKIASGLMCRHSVARQALIDKIRDGQLGNIQLIRAYRMGGRSHLKPRKPGENELQWQIRNKFAFPWVSSGRLIEYLIHQIDECCWLKDSWPVAAHGLGGRAANNFSCGQNLDTYAVEYTFADGTTALVNSRDMSECHNDFVTYVHGAKRAAQFSGQTHRATVHTFRDQRIRADDADWSADPEPCTPWQAEWNVLLDAIRNDRPHNETRRAINSNLASIMGRAAVHTGNIVTWDQICSSNFQFCPHVDQLTLDSPAPVLADADGRYPIPIPGSWVEV